MSDIKPGVAVHRGTVHASGFMIHFDLVSAAEARRRIFKIWQPDATVYRLATGLALVLPVPILVAAEDAIGVPLVWDRHERVLAAAPLSEKEMAGLDGVLAFVAGGKLVTQRFTDLAGDLVERVEDWIDVDGFRFERGVSLGGTAVKPSPVAQPRMVEIRETLGDIPARAPETSWLLSSLKESGRMQGPRESFSLSRVFSFIRGIVSSGAALPQSYSGRPTVTTSRFALWLNSVAERFAMMTRLSKAIGWRQARYLSQVLEMFESGDLNSALRHAIPLSSISESSALRTSFGLPSPRQSLQITARRSPANSRMGIGQSLYNHLLQLYRETATRLEARGRIEEAAFVLAELLQANAEAVALLEKHGKLRQAAEIAEGRGLAAEIVVRQWYIAGEKQRAFQIARKTGAFAGAVISLEKSGHALAAVLRKDWACALADSGNPAAAVDVLWPLQSERAAAVGWMKEAVELGGEGGARSLARLLAMPAGQADVYWNRALRLLQTDSPEDAATRAAFAEALCAQPASVHTQTLARAAVRAEIRDLGRGLESLGGRSMTRLIDYSNDGALRADVPPRPVVRPAGLWAVIPPVRHVVKLRDHGAVTVYDAAPLPSGGCVLALGEAGLKIVTKDGRSIAHADQPAFQLVPSHNGGRVIAVAPRGRLSMLSKFDVLERKADPWCLTELDAFTTSFDGATWYVLSGGDLWAIDATSQNFDALWRIPDIGVPAGPLTLMPSALNFVAQKGDEAWLWEYRIPTLRLTARTLVATRSVEGLWPLFAACGSGTLLSTSDPRDTVGFQRIGGPGQTLLRLSKNESIASLPVVTGKWVAFAVQALDYARVLTYSIERQGPPVLRMEVLLEGGDEPAVRLDDSLLTIAYKGDVRAYELAHGQALARWPKAGSLI